MVLARKGERRPCPPGRSIKDGRVMIVTAPILPDGKSIIVLQSDVMPDDRYRRSAQARRARLRGVVRRAEARAYGCGEQVMGDRRDHERTSRDDPLGG